MATTPLATELRTVPRDSLRVAGADPAAGRGSGMKGIFATQRELLESATRRLILLRLGIKKAGPTFGGTTRGMQMPRLIPTFGGTTRAGAAHDCAPTSLPPASVHVRRLLRNKIAADPDAFFEEADADRSWDLSWGEWVTACQMFAGEGAEPEPALLRELFAEVAGDAGDSATITRERLSEVAQLHRAVRHFVDKAGCADVLVDGIVTSLVRKLRSERPVQEVRVQQGAEGSEGKAASHVLQELLATVCEDDAPVHDVAAALQVQAEIVKAQLAARADAPPPAASDQDDAAKSKFSDLPVSWRCAACAPHSLSSHASDARMRVRCPCFFGGGRSVAIGGLENTCKLSPKP